MKLNIEFRDYEYERYLEKVKFYLFTFLGATFILFFVLLGLARAETIDVQRLANAIYKAEGVNSRYPYGILTKYKTTTPRQACINTINHALRDWNGKGDFIAFLGSRYCPVNCDNDNGTNKYWIKNVHYWYEIGMKG